MKKMVDFERIGSELVVKRDVKDVFQSEDTFNLWLSNNLSLITKSIGIDYDPVSCTRERTLGSGRTDIYLKDNHGRVVVIESQVGQSDDGHLGKLQRYIGESESGGNYVLAGVMICGKVSDGILAAVQSLNSNSKRSRIYLIEAEFYEVRGHGYHPKFNVEGISLIGGRESKNTKSSIVRDDFMRFSNSKGALQLSLPSNNNEVTSRLGVTGIYVQLSFNVAEGTVKCQLIIDGKNQDRYVQGFVKDEVEIRKSLGVEVEFNLSRPDGIRKTIGLVDEVDFYYSESPDFFQRYYEMMKVFDLTFRSRIECLKYAGL
ncbi:MAG: hypothetical protein CL693_13690 [Cellvibrionaceae bacterium]|nr:hypothetical protein [Cellvibrionaceae bacterium]|tara:strand:+ start:2975 stop:3922 length:948 start_codon:yes stop_codon:yes gene_type:complete